MKNLLFILACSFVLFSCGSVADGRRAYKKHLKETLKDPESLRIYNEKIVSQKDNEVKFIVDIGAKNSYGAYTRETYSFRTIGKNVVQVGDEFAFDKKPEPKKPEPTEEEIRIYSEYTKLVPLATEPPTPNIAVNDIITAKREMICAYEKVDYWQMREHIKDQSKKHFNILLRRDEITKTPSGMQFKIVKIHDYCLEIEVLSKGKFKGKTLFTSKTIPQ